MSLSLGSIGLFFFCAANSWYHYLTERERLALICTSCTKTLSLNGKPSEPRQVITLFLQLCVNKRERGESMSTTLKMLAICFDPMETERV